MSYSRGSCCARRREWAAPPRTPPPPPAAWTGEIEMRASAAVADSAIDARRLRGRRRDAVVDDEEEEGAIVCDADCVIEAES